MMARNVLLWLLALLALTLPARAGTLPREVEDALPREARTLLRDVPGWEGAGLLEGLVSIWEGIRHSAAGLLRAQTRGAARILLVAVLCGLVGNVGKSAADPTPFLPMAAGLAVTLLTAGSLDSMMGSAAAVMEQMNTFSRALLPALAAAAAAAGGVTGASVRQIATVFFADLLLEATRTVLMPLVYLYAGVVTAGSSLRDRRLSALGELIRTVTVKLLSAALLAFTLYLTVSGIFAASVDSASIRVTKAAISGTVPVVGGIIAEASEAVLAGAGMLKAGIGMFGLLGVLALCAYPFLEIGGQYLLYQLTAFLAAAVADNGLQELIRGLGRAFGLILGMVGSCALVLLVSILASAAAVGGG